MTTRSDVVAAARGWLGTPFHHQARLKDVGVDCAGLLIGVARELDLVAPDFDVTNYSRVPDGSSLIAWCDQYMTRIPGEQMQPGHMVVVRMDIEPQHIGVLGDYRHGGLSIIHAVSVGPRQGVIETRLMWSRAMGLVAAYALPGVN
jgi:cell wall-associated NlpC family hydrolase